jgi:hypothetical protein
MAKKSIYEGGVGPDGPFGYGSKPKKNPGFGKKGNVDRSDAGRDETESVPSLGQRDKKPFKAPAPSDVGRLTLKGKK